MIFPSIIDLSYFLILTFVQCINCDFCSISSKVQNALQKPYTALDTFNEALQINPKSAVCKFHRASLYYNSGRYQEALAELQELQGLVPKESSVFYLTAKVSSTFILFC